MPSNWDGICFKIDGPFNASIAFFKDCDRKKITSVVFRSSVLCCFLFEAVVARTRGMADLSVGLSARQQRLSLDHVPWYFSNSEEGSWFFEDLAIAIRKVGGIRRSRRFPTTGTVVVLVSF